MPIEEQKILGITEDMIVCGYWGEERMCAPFSVSEGKTVEVNANLDYATW